MIGISGAHRTGKTTICESLTKRGIVFKPIEISKCSVWDDLGSESIQLTFAERLSVQEELFNYLERKLMDIRAICNNDVNIIVDRTPIDLIGYLLTNIDSTTSNLLKNRTIKLIEECIAVTNYWFKGIIIVQPGIKVKTTDTKKGKTYNSYVYQEALNSVILGQLQNFHGSYLIIPKDELQLDKRIKRIVNWLEQNF